jgi:hypothetical protein
MSDNFSQSDLGFIRAFSRELIVNNRKDYEDIQLAIEDAEHFVKLFAHRYPNKNHTRSRYDNDNSGG